jgi:hypothetical protein
MKMQGCRVGVVSLRAGLALMCAVIPATTVRAELAAAAATKPSGPGVEFDGKTAYAVPAKSLSVEPSALTVSAWVQVANPKDSQIFLNSGTVNRGFNLYLYNGQVRMLVGYKVGAYAHAAAPAPKAGQWTHYAGTFDGDVIRIYMNGKLQKETKSSGRITGLGDSLSLGALKEGERALSGRLEDVRIYRRVLDDKQVAALAGNAADAGLAEELIASWQSGDLKGDKWNARQNEAAAASKVAFAAPKVLINEKDDGYRGIWYMNQPSKDEYVYKYSGGMAVYCSNHNPHSWYAKEVNKTFFTYGGSLKEDSTHLMHMVSYYDHATGMVPRPTILLDKHTDDAHDNPVLNLDDKGYIWIFSSSHGTGRPSYISKSTKPYYIDSFELVWTGNFSYPQPWFVPGQGFILMHTYYAPGRSICMMTSPDGVNWSERRRLSYIDEGHYQISRPLPGGKIGTFFNHHPKGKGLNWRTNVYYMESDDFGKTWKAADGTVLNLPLTEINNPALVHDYASEGLNMYTQDLAADTQGRPVLMYITSKGYESGPKNGPRTWTIAHWTGSKWDISGGDIVSGNNYDLGPLYVESENLWRIIGPTQLGPQPYNPGGEIAMWTSADQGHHWTMVRQMTKGSEYNHAYARRPVNANPDFYAIWADGHGRKPSDSRIYFCNQKGDVFRLPTTMPADFAKPELIKPAE